MQGWLMLPAHYDPSQVLPDGGAGARRPGLRGTSARWGGSAATSLSAMGYFVLQPNPRGSYGQGEKFTHANCRDFGYGDLRDILAGVDAVEKAYPDRRQAPGPDAAGATAAS